jgi:hypothetical protein
MHPPLPTLERYLGELPLGVDSHPEAGVKGSVLRSLQHHPAFESIVRHPGLPAPVAQLLREPPTATTWVPEVHFNTAMTALYDVVFRDDGGLPRYEMWVAEENVKLLSTPLYQILFAVVGAQRLLAAAPARWAAFRRGSTLSLLRSEKQIAELRLVYPRNLESAVSLHGFAGAFRAAARVARADVQSVTVTPELGVSARFTIAWR